MDQHTPAEGGTANTPPFPRAERGPEPSPPMPEAPPTTAEPGAPAAGDNSDMAAFGDPPLPAGGPIGDPPAEPKDRPVELGATSDGPEMPDISPEDADVDDLDEREIPPRTTGRTDDVRRRASQGINRGFERIAESIDEAADRIGQIADTRLQGEGPYARAGDFAHTTSHWLEGVADYLRTADLRQMQEDLEKQVRQKPVQTLLLAAGTGWILGRIMR